MNPIQSFLDFMKMGGFSMWFLLLCSILAIAVSIERAVKLRKVSVDAEWLIQQIALFLQDGKTSETIEYLRAIPGILPKVLEAGLLRFDKKKEEIEVAIANAIQEQTAVLEQYTGILGTITVVAPFLGLLGTVTGIIASFSSIAMKNTTGAGVIAKGIYEALYTTAVGLIIAIPTVVVYNYYKERIKSMVTEMEICGNRMVEMIMLTRRNEPFPEDLLPEGYEPKKKQ